MSGVEQLGIWSGSLVVAALAAMWALDRWERRRQLRETQPVRDRAERLSAEQVRAFIPNPRPGGTIYSSVFTPSAASVVELAIRNRTTLGFRRPDRDLIRATWDMGLAVGRRSRRPLSQDHEPPMSQDLDMRHVDSGRVMSVDFTKAQRERGLEEK